MERQRGQSQCDSQQGRAEAPKTPIADLLAEIGRKRLSSFHALPVSNGNSFEGGPFADKYNDLFGPGFFRSEQTVSGDMFDSFFFSSRVIKDGERLAAAAFHADGTLFVTSGTTVSNQIAISALCKPGDQVLADRQSHQSIHFSLHAAMASVDYLAPKAECQESGRSFWSLDDLLAKCLRKQERGGDGYSLVVLSASSYDGVVYNIPRILRALLEGGVKCRRFLVDEAWGTGNYFIDGMSECTAMASGRLLEDWPDLVVVATQSAHKSIGSMRQSSMIHYVGASVDKALRNARFRIHTTSPSYPILASLDLARAQVQQDGREMFSRAVRLASLFRDRLENDPGLGLYRLNSMGSPEDAHVAWDPTKVSVNVSETGMSPGAVKEALYSKFNIYANRITESSILFNFHVGIGEGMVDALADALRSVAPGSRGHGPRVNDFIISYPPGIPLAVPGDAMTGHLRRRMRSLENSGAMLVEL